MAMKKMITDQKKQLILELYFCSDDRRFWVISETLNVSVSTVSDTIQKYFDREIEFLRGNYKIMHSEMNNIKYKNNAKTTQAMSTKI